MAAGYTFEKTGANPMRKEFEYRTFAAACLELASKTSATVDKARLLAMAEAWLNLADRTARPAKRRASQIADHPLVIESLDQYSGTEGS
jgi:hypothetical protein